MQKWKPTLRLVKPPKDAKPGDGAADVVNSGGAAAVAVLATVPIAAEDAWPKPEMPRNPLLSVPAFTRDMLPAVLAGRVFHVATKKQGPPRFLPGPLVVDLGLRVRRPGCVRPDRGSLVVVPNLPG